MQGFAPRAQADLDETVSWLLDHGMNAAAAERLLTAVLGAAKLLAERPLLGRFRLDLLPEPFRFWSIPRHGLLLVYRAEGDRVRILRVLHTRRDLVSLLDATADDLDDPGPG